MPAQDKAVFIKVRGSVQGVFYRASAQAEARRLAITGWVRNAPDGTVEAFAQGMRGDVDAFIQWCSHGPSYAHVTAISTETKDIEPAYTGFLIVR